MRNPFDNGFIDIGDIMPDSQNNKIKDLSEEEKQQYLEEKISKFETDDSFLDGIDFQEDENTFLDNLSREMYLVIGLYNLNHYSEDESLSFDKKVSELKALGEETDKIMDIRRIIYNELKEAASSKSTTEDESSNYIKICNESPLTHIEFMDIKVKNIIIELSKKLLLNEKLSTKLPTEESKDNNYLINALRDLEKSVGYVRENILYDKCVLIGIEYIVTPLKDFVTKIMHIIVDLSMNMIDNEKFTNTKTKFFETVKNYHGMPHGDKLWGLYLLSVLISNNAVEASDKSTNTFKEMIEHMEEILEDNQKYEYQVFNVYNYQEKYLLAQQKRNNAVSTCLYFITHTPSKEFYNINHVRKIVKVLRGSKLLRDKYIDMSIFYSKSNRNGRSCFAIMGIDYSGKRYVSISGVNINQSSTQHLMSKLIDTSYFYVDDKADYYLPDGHKISLQGLQCSGYLTTSEIKKVNTNAYNRMFSCCERKFVKHLEQGQKHKIYVKYPPCYMCKRMIDEEENKDYKIDIIYPESKSKDYNSVVNKEKEYDDIAKKALNI